MAHLTQISIKHNLTEELFNIRAAARQSNELLQQETQFPAYPSQVLRAPRKLQYCPDQDLRCRVNIYFQQVLGGRRTGFAVQLPEVMPLWGK
ncbi:hypothetical protein BS17DRAFT_772037 [Gyrodon lividus]|nr:hypothetical protein BS17DRAFT_772037 [Gyrodon lividus]